jgi:ferredoxin
MENRVYYFSGRGNSLSVARNLAERLDGAEIKPMAAEKGIVTLPAGRVGLVLPVIDFGIPAFVRRFIGKLRVGGVPPYVFAVITCGGMPGASVLQLKKLLAGQGLKLSAAWVVRFGLERMPEGEWGALLDAITAAVAGRAELPLTPVDLKDRLMTGLGNPLARLIIPGEDRKFRVDASCTGCGVCAKVCPAENIRLEGGRPVWQHKCEQCAACFGWCPKEAISGTCLAARTRYTNPGVKLGHMLDGEGES